MSDVTTVPVAVSPRRTLQVLVVVDAVLLAAHVAIMWLVFHADRTIEAVGLLDMDAEVSAPTWWAQSKLLVAAVLAMAVGAVLRELRASDHRFWIALGLVFLAMSIDEGSEIHERFIDPMRDLFDITSGVFYFAWLIPGIALVGLFGATFFGFWTRLPSPAREGLAIGGAVFLTGAFGAEMIGGDRESAHGKDFTYAMITGVEETLELVGASVVLAALLVMVRVVAADRVAVLVTSVTDDER